MNAIRRMAYSLWIESEVQGDGYGKCEEVSKRMHGVFPELEVRFGFFMATAPWGRRQHWWLRTSEGEIVDPTGRQHPNGDLFPQSSVLYEDLTDLDDEALADKVPTGVCMDCGGPVYRGQTFCNETCEEATRAYMEGEVNL